MPESLGELLGPYRLEHAVGEGTMGRVWAARHVALDRRVAIKVLRDEHAGNAQVIERFFDEARAVNRIDHEHIVEIYDFVREPGRVYCVMEYLEGRPLSEAGPLPVQACLSVLRQVCDALAAAHRVGVVHRDVKPDNIFLTRRPGSELFVKVLDFGVAKLGGPLKRAAALGTVQGTLLGTPLYMAPEQIVGLDVDGRADIYAVGCLIYWLLAGRLPFESPHLGELSIDVVEREPPPLPTLTPQGERVPPGLAGLAMWCLSKLRDDRPQKMEQVLEALEQPMVAPKRPRRAPAMRSAVVGAALSAAAAAALLWSHVQRVEMTSTDPERLIAKKAKVVTFDEDGTIDPFAR